MKRILTTGDIAKHCGVNLRTVIRWIERGHLKAYKLPGRGDNRVQLEDFLEFLEQNQMPVPDAFANPRRNVLLVEQDPALKSVIESALSEEPVELRSANNGFQAGVLLSTFKPSLVIVDLDAAQEDGTEILSYLRSNHQFEQARAIVLVSKADDRQQFFLDAGADAVLGKPLKVAAFMEAFHGLCRH